MAQKPNYGHERRAQSQAGRRKQDKLREREEASAKHKASRTDDRENPDAKQS
jgi:hypothetical protein